MYQQHAQRQLAQRLTPLHGEREAALIADWVLERLTGRKRIDRLLSRSEPLSPQALERYEKYRAELLAGRPVQYVLQESWFCGMKFYVDERVLIPRPETEELVEWVAQTVREEASAGNPNTTVIPATGDGGSDTKAIAPNGDTKAIAPSGGTGEGISTEDPGTQADRLLDVGTGSGCIAISLAKQLPALQVHAVDTSVDALAVARRNAAGLGAEVRFHVLDFPDPRGWDTLPPIRWLVSNPPYIPLKEKDTMAVHVTAYEPALALFVADDDPLLFYRALADFARQRLVKGGSVFAEIHEAMGATVPALFRAAGCREVHLRKDLQGKDRMVKATW